MPNVTRTRTSKPVFMPSPRWWNAEQVAIRLGRSVGWLAAHAKELHGEGFPVKDAKFGMWDAHAIDRWMDARSGFNSVVDEEQEMLNAIHGQNKPAIPAV